MQIASNFNYLLFLSLNLLLTVQLLLFELVLQKFNLLQLRVKLQLKVVDDVAEVPSLVLKLFVLYLKSNYALRVIQPFLNGLLELFLKLFELVFVLNRLFFVNLLVLLGTLELRLRQRKLFLSFPQALF